MRILKGLGELLSPNDPELVEKTLARLGEQDKWNDVFSTKLIELLDKIDKVKSDIHERLQNADERIQKAESITQTESLLLEKAKRFGDASQRLELAEAAERRASLLAEDARSQLGSARIALENARREAESARSESENANKQLRLARETEAQAARLSRVTLRYAAGAVALSCIAMGWTAWFADRTPSIFWAAVCWSTLVLIAAVFVVKGTQSDT